MTVARTPAHTALVPIRWGDMDAQGHVNNAVYFRYMEQARIEWLELARTHVGDSELQGIGQVIVTASCTFLLPLTYPGTVQVRMFLDVPGRSSVESHYEFWVGDQKHAHGAAKIVWIDNTSLRSTPMPDRLRAFLQ